MTLLEQCEAYLAKVREDPEQLADAEIAEGNELCQQLIKIIVDAFQPLLRAIREAAEQLGTYLADIWASIPDIQKRALAIMVETDYQVPPQIALNMARVESDVTAAVFPAGGANRVVFNTMPPLPMLAAGGITNGPINATFAADIASAFGLDTRKNHS